MADHEMDLGEAFQPFGLLLLVNQLSRMERGQVLQVRVPDLEVVDHILKIMRHTENQVLGYGEAGSRYRIRILKGAPR